MWGEASGTVFEREAVGRRLGANGFHTLQLFDAKTQQEHHSTAWIPERSATRLREADLNILSKLGKQGLERRLEPAAFAGCEVGREDDLLDFLVGCPVDIEVARQPSA